MFYVYIFPYRKERDRAREEHTSAVNKMFSLQNEGDDQGSRYSVIPQIQKVCEVVDGFIYVANAEAQKSKHYRMFVFKALAFQSK